MASVVFLKTPPAHDHQTDACLELIDQNKTPPIRSGKASQGCCQSEIRFGINRSPRQERERLASESSVGRIVDKEQAPGHSGKRSNRDTATTPPHSSMSGCAVKASGVAPRPSCFEELPNLPSDKDRSRWVSHRKLRSMSAEDPF